MDKENVSPEEEWSDTENYECSTIEDFTDLTGKCGKWQKILLFLIIYIGIFSCFSGVNLPFVAPKIDHWCARSSAYKNISVEEWKNSSIPIEIRNGEYKYSQCQIYEDLVSSSVNNNTNVRLKTTCSSWEYDHSFYTSTIVDKWDLVCKDSWRVPFVASAYFIGYLLSSIVSGQLSDRFGRRPVLIGGMIILLVFGVLTVLIPYYWVYATFIFFIAIGRTGIFTAFYVLLTEVLGTEYRSLAGTLTKVGWGFGQIFLPGVAWIFRDWVYIHLCSVLPFVLIFGFWSFIPESPRWLFCQGRHKEAKFIIRKAMKIDKQDHKNLNDALDMLSDKIERENENNYKQYSVIELFRNNYFRKITLILYILWIFIIFIFYSLAFNADDIGGSIYINFALFGIMDFPSSLMVHLLLKRIGRRSLTASLMFINGLTCVITIAIPNSLTWLRISLVVGSKFFISSAGVILMIYTSEVYPTVVRNVGMGSCYTVARIGAICAPFTKQASQMVHWSLPFIIFGVLSAIGALLMLLLPETKDAQLSDSFTNGTINKRTVLEKGILRLCHRSRK